eukprot:TRINITY_DN3034_c0_g2_i6.p1 TRINITY_DN3034_c0_g2~~TRINITY_DN3034_c0_g2_i6.p1  ORF type:complete len:651 (+),score=123.56 TRINITY_DN3034_c0_g2_i6:2211-4163(+)
MNNPNEVTLKFRTEASLVISGTTRVLDIITALKKSFLFNLPGSPETKDFEIKADQLGPCYGFSRTYRCISRYMGIPYRDDICFVIDNIYGPNQIREMNFGDWFEPPTLHQAKAIIDSLKYNKWFESLVISGSGASKVGNDAIMIVASMLQHNRTITKLVLDHVPAREAWIFGDTWEGFALNNYLTVLNFANNQIEDRGVQAFCDQYLANVCHPMQAINLSKCGLTKAGLSTFLQTIRGNKWIGKNLKFLALSENKLEEASTALVDFIAIASSLKQLEISDVSPNWLGMRAPDGQENVAKKDLPIGKLDLSGNPFGKGEGMVDLVSFLLGLCPNVTDLDLSECTIPTSLPGFTSLFEAAPNLVRLNISDNDLGEDGIVNLVEVLSPLGANPPGILPRLRHLNISNNMPSNPNPLIVKPRSYLNAVKALVHLISAETYPVCPIDSLHVRGGSKDRLKIELLPLITALLNNNTLTDLDIRGHRVGDELAVNLGRVLSGNRTLKILYWDENNTTLMGLENFSMGLRRNLTLERMPIPVLDIADYLKLPENTQGMQLFKERLKIGEKVGISIQERTTQLISEFQGILIQNSVSSFKDKLIKEAARKKLEHEQNYIDNNNNNINDSNSNITNSSNNVSSVSNGSSGNSVTVESVQK